MLQGRPGPAVATSTLHPWGGDSAFLSGPVTRALSEISPCHPGPPWRSQKCHTRGLCLGSSLHSQNVPLLGAQPWVPVMKSSPQLGQVNPRQPSAHGIGEGQPPRAPVLLRRPGPPVPRGPAPAPPALTCPPTAPSPCCTRWGGSRVPLGRPAPFSTSVLPACQLSVPHPPGVRGTADQPPRPPRSCLTL